MRTLVVFLLVTAVALLVVADAWAPPHWFKHTH